VAFFCARLTCEFTHLSLHNSDSALRTRRSRAERHRARAQSLIERERLACGISASALLRPKTAANRGLRESTGDKKDWPTTVRRSSPQCHLRGPKPSSQIAVLRTRRRSQINQPVGFLSRRVSPREVTREFSLARRVMRQRLTKRELNLLDISQVQRSLDHQAHP
jgi:hypothetical protein